MKIKAIAFDLDDTLLDTSQILIPIFGTPQFWERIQKPLPLMPGALDNLNFLKSKYTLFLVTQGDPTVQKQKIASLGIEHHFVKIFFANSENGETKGSCFRELLVNFDIESSKLLSIGNRRSAEIREAKRLGAQTCLFLHGEHILDPAESALDIPDFEVSSHFDLVDTCKL